MPAVEPLLTRAVGAVRTLPVKECDVHPVAEMLREVDVVEPVARADVNYAGQIARGSRPYQGDHVHEMPVIELVVGVLDPPFPSWSRHVSHFGLLSAVVVSLGHRGVADLGQREKRSRDAGQQYKARREHRNYSSPPQDSTLSATLLSVVS
eukprot:5346530-Prymnesium_polylepis.1